MTPLDFLAEEARSVELTLNETLRHDYGPERSKSYFEECRVRLDIVKRALSDYPEMDRGMIATHAQALSSLGSRISLIERAHLGEFSWPFAAMLERVAEVMFVEKSWGKDLEQIDMKPIVHVVAEGTDYQIVDDEMPPPGERRIIIVAFPRQLKHHVLLHAIFGHELGHIAINAERPGLVMKTKVIPKATCGPLQDKVQADAWLRHTDAPAGVKSALSRDETLGFQEQSLINWRHEIICDLFGLRLFGPAFAAAHRTIIQALCPRDDFFDLGSTTHPTYPIRQRVLAQAIKILGWDQAVSTADDGPLHAAENALIAYISESVPHSWFQIYDRSQLQALLSAIEELLGAYGLNYIPLRREDLCELVKRLAQERPPISQAVDAEGMPENRDIDGSHCLYAGWSYWFGRAALTEEARSHDTQVLELTFLELNRLCDQALLQQRAIQLVNEVYR